MCFIVQGQSASRRCDKTEATLKVTKKRDLPFAGWYFWAWMCDGSPHCDCCSSSLSSYRLQWPDMLLHCHSWTAQGEEPCWTFVLLPLPEPEQESVLVWHTGRLLPVLPTAQGPCTSAQSCQSQGREDFSNNGTHQPQLWKLSCCSWDLFEDLSREAKHPEISVNVKVVWD